MLFEWENCVKLFKAISSLYILDHPQQCFWRGGEESITTMECQKEAIMEVESQTHDDHNPKGTSFLRTCFNGINALSGVGILSIPFALSHGGWLSLAILLLVASLCFYTALLLRRCMDTDTHIRTYPDIGYRAFGPMGRTLVSVFLYLELYLVAVEFLILEGDNLDKLFPNTSFRVFGGVKLGGKEAFVLLSGLVILPTTWVRSLGIMAYVSVGGVVASIVLVVCVFWVGAFDGVGFHENGQILRWEGLPTSISLFTFCYCGHAVFPTLCTSMKNKTQFPKVLLVCFVVATFTYGSMAVMGYLMFGDHLNSQVTLNLPVAKLSSKVAIYTTLVNPVTKYADNKLLSILARTGIVVSTVIVAITVPFFGYVMAFIGSSLSVLASLILPCLCYIRIEKSARRFGLELVLIVGILIIGVVVGIVGTYTSVKQIVKHM
ncbi:Amino acid transporter AVT1J [Linum perenne]